VAGCDSATVRLADVTGAVIEVPTAGLLADPSLELVTASRVPMAPQPTLERLPAEAVETARWWERHLIEVITGVPPGSPPGTGPRPDYDPARRSLRQRELAKHEELTRAGHQHDLRSPGSASSAPIYANAVSRDLACANTGASRPHSSPRSLSSQQAPASTMAPAVTC
jgi:hypothetical protein